MSAFARDDSEYLTTAAKLTMMSWGLVLLICMIAAAGVALLYSAAGGAWEPWAGRQAARFGVGLLLMVAIALVDIRYWMKIAYAIYGIVFLLLIAVEVMGRIGMGAQRWIDLGVITLQPSELMKIALVLALARYFHGLTLPEIRHPLTLFVPLFLILTPVALVLLQPNLGTATLLLLTGGAMMFLAGINLRWFVLAIAVGLSSLPIAWQFLHDYQKERIFTFLDPSRDPLGAGYNITQSMIAFGSGGMFGKGFLGGTQSQLAFLPEKHTDFIFVVLAEEFGLAGAFGLLALYALLLAYGIFIGLFARSQFGRLVALGLTTTIFLYVAVNVAMVTGLIPVVGIPLPLVSNGGTAMMTLLVACGLMLSVSIHRHVRIPRAGVSEL